MRCTWTLAVLLVLAGGVPARADEKPAEVAAQARAAGQAALQKGDAPRALALHRRALQIREQLGDRAGVTESVLDLAETQARLGAYAEALGLYERGTELAEAEGARAAVARALAGRAEVHAALGRAEQAVQGHERALAIQRKLGDVAALATTLGGLADVLAREGEYQKAQALLEEAHRLHAERGDERGVADTLSRRAELALLQGEHERALAAAEQALAAHRALGDAIGGAKDLRTLGRTLLALGRKEEGLRTLERAAREVRALRHPALSARILTDLAKARLASAADERAIAEARQALTQLEAVLGGLADADAEGARESHAALYDVGLAAALKSDDLAAAFHFTESARAGALASSILGRPLRRQALVPPALRAEFEEAQTRVRSAQVAHDAARDAGERAPIMQSHRALDTAKEHLAHVAARLEREAARGAGLFLPRPATLEALRGGLRDGEVLVQYVLTGRAAVALVNGRDGSRVVSLGARAPLEALVEAAQELGDPEKQPGDVLARLRAALVTPLRLPVAVKTVIVSPAGALGALPFGALFEHPVALVPSASVFVLLRSSSTTKGDGVLAVGDPAFGPGSHFVPLPATRAEAQGVGSVLLLGTEASETALRKTLAGKKRWRAVHLASHGLRDPEHPLFSAMALTPDEQNDGYLTALEVHRSVIPADLVVLSGSETALGRIYRHEGIVGLTRAFLAAGASRVIGSLWHVDDEATRALMIAFYGHWQKGDSAAAALVKAQAHVRAQERWQHPYYYAGWVLWGLP